MSHKAEKKRHRVANAIRSDAAALEKELATAKRKASAAAIALRNSIEVLELAHAQARVAIESTLRVATPEQLRSALIAFAKSEHQLDALISIPKELRDAAWDKDWSQTLDIRDRSQMAVLQAGLLFAKDATEP